MAEVFAGFVCGYVVALVLAPVAAVALVRGRAVNAAVARMLPPGTPFVAVAIVLHGGLMLFWTGIGIVMGLLLLAMRGERGALGSRNLAFTLFVFGLVLALAAPAAVVSRRYRMAAVAIALLIVALFGWLMPYLAEWSTFD